MFHSLCRSDARCSRRRGSQTRAWASLWCTRTGAATMSCAWCVFLKYGNDGLSTLNPALSLSEQCCTAHRDPNTRCACACLQLLSGASRATYTHRALPIVAALSAAGCDIGTGDIGDDTPLLWCAGGAGALLKGGRGRCEDAAVAEVPGEERRMRQRTVIGDLGSACGTGSDVCASALRAARTWAKP